MVRAGFLTIFLVLVTWQINAQRWLVGGGIVYCSYVDNPGINLNLTYRVIRNFYVGPDVSALLTKKSDVRGTLIKRKELEYNFNGHYLFDLNEHASLYPIFGLNASKLTVHTAGEYPVKRSLLAANFGGGMELRMRIVRTVLEIKYTSTIEKVDVSAGVVFPLGNNSND